MSLSLANDHAGLPIAFQLYLSEEWAQDPQRRAKAGVPATIAFHSKSMIALTQIRAALLAGVSPAVVLADAGYGCETAFRTALTRMGLTYLVGISSSTSLWPPGTGPLPPQPWSGRGRGRPPTLLRRDPQRKPIFAQKLAKDLPGTAWHVITWRDGFKAALTSRGCAAGGVVSDRMTRGREAADQVLALDPARGHRSGAARRSGKTALAH